MEDFYFVAKGISPPFSSVTLLPINAYPFSSREIWHYRDATCPGKDLQGRADREGESSDRGGRRREEERRGAVPGESDL